MSDQDLVELAQDVDVRCRPRGDFVVRSGAGTHEYFDKYLFAADPVLSAHGQDQVTTHGITLRSVKTTDLLDSVARATYR